MNPSRLQRILNEKWEIYSDPDDVGKDDKWHEDGNLPEGTSLHNKDGRAALDSSKSSPIWLKHEFSLDSSWSDHDVCLSTPLIPSEVEIWLNGRPLEVDEFVGDTSSVPLEGLHPDTSNVLLLRISPRRSRVSYIRAVETISLFGLPSVRIHDVFILPDTRRKRITVHVDSPADTSLRISIDGTRHRTDGAPGALMLDFPDFEWWSLDSPQLYTLHCECIRDDVAVDWIDVPFGMREFTIRDDRFRLNQRALYVKGVDWDPYVSPDNAGSKLSEELRPDLEHAKGAGFNLIRIRNSAFLESVLAVTDELGLLVSVDLHGEELRERQSSCETWQSDFRSVIRRTRNHPSLAVWQVGLREETKSNDEDARPSLFARELDPSRLILESVRDEKRRDTFSSYLRPFREDRLPLFAFRVHQHPPLERQVELYLDHTGSGHEPTFLSEFGCEDLGRLSMDPSTDEGNAYGTEFRTRELERTFGEMEALVAESRQASCDALRLQIDALRSNSRVVGYCLSELRDCADGPARGLLDLQGNPKPALEAVGKAQERLRPRIHLGHTNLALRQEVPIKITLSNEPRLEGRGELSLQVVGPTNQVLWKKKRGVKIPRHGKELWAGTISASGTPGPHKFVVRLFHENRPVAENWVDFYVYDAPTPYPESINVLDPGNGFLSRCAELVSGIAATASIHVIAPIGNTIRAYPDNDLAQILGQVKEGATALFFSPPEDWNDLADIIDPGIRATSKLSSGTVRAAYRYAKFHPVFDGLPARALMRQPYRNVVAPKTFLESGEEDICGTIRPSDDVEGVVGPGWGTDILVTRYGQGRVVFTHLRVLEYLRRDPVADTLFVNLLKHFSRRSLPSVGTLPIHQKSVEWLRSERSEHVRRWMVLGMFPNWGDGGLDKLYPPEEDIDFEAAYPGWYEAISWKPWYSTRGHGFLLDLQEAFSPVYQEYPRTDFGVGYAYGEFVSDTRAEIDLRIGVQDATKVWLNRIPIFEERGHFPDGGMKEETIRATVRQGRNTVLVKVAKVPGPFRFLFDIADGEGVVHPKWWR